jgi:hypothetical protein
MVLSWYVLSFLPPYNYHNEYRIYQSIELSHAKSYRLPWIYATIIISNCTNITHKTKLP